MRYVTGLRCLRCETLYPPAEIEYLCSCRPNQGSDLGTLDVEYDYARMAAEAAGGDIIDPTQMSIARYGPLLPLDSVGNLPPIAVGQTPLYHATRLGEETGFFQLYIKDDGRNPSASLKDRASAVAVAKARELGYGVVATASTGNAAAALAQQAAAAAMPCVIFVPKSAPPAKVAQLLVFGAHVFAVRGSYDQAFDLCVEACRRFGWYNRNTGMNPYMSEGKKTVAFEIAEQLAQFDAPAAGRHNQVPLRGPDAVFVSVGDGCIIGGVYKGFYDLAQLGRIDHLPRLYGVQSSQSAALYEAWRKGMAVPEPVNATTRADSISVDAPRDAIKALRAVSGQTGAHTAASEPGGFVLVDDDEILAAIPHLARKAGVFAEPAGAAAWAGFMAARAKGLIAPHERVVVIITGNGLKDVGAVGLVGGKPLEIEPVLEDVASHVGAGWPV